MKSKLTLIYMAFCASMLVAAIGVQTAHGEQETTVTGLSGEGLRSVINAIRAE